MSPFLMNEGIKRRTSLFFLYEGLPFSLFTYSNKPLMSTRITSLCRVLNSFVLLVHSWVLLMLLHQGLCPTENVNAATGSTLYYIFAFLLHSANHGGRFPVCSCWDAYAALGSPSLWISDIILNLS